ELARSRGHKIDLRMAEKQTHQFFAGVTGSAYDRDLRFRHNGMRISSRADCNEKLRETQSCVSRRRATKVATWNLPLFSSASLSWRFSVSYSRLSFSTFSESGSGPGSRMRRLVWEK